MVINIDIENVDWMGNIDKNKNKIEKSKVYLSEGQQAPKGATVKQGKRGGRYYETQEKVVAPAEVEKYSTYVFKGVDEDEGLKHLKYISKIDSGTHDEGDRQFQVEMANYFHNMVKQLPTAQVKTIKMIEYKPQKGFVTDKGFHGVALCTYDNHIRMYAATLKNEGWLALVHEMAHCVHNDLLRDFDPLGANTPSQKLCKEIQDAYDWSMKFEAEFPTRGGFPNEYAMSDVKEYFAECYKAFIEVMAPNSPHYGWKGFLERENPKMDKILRKVFDYYAQGGRGEEVKKSVDMKDVMSADPEEIMKPTVDAKLRKAAFSPDAPKVKPDANIKDQGYSEVNVGGEHIGKAMGDNGIGGFSVQEQQVAELKNQQAEIRGNGNVPADKNTSKKTDSRNATTDQKGGDDVENNKEPYFEKGFMPDDGELYNSIDRLMS